MMLSNSSSLMGIRRSLSDPNMVRELRKQIRISNKSMRKFSCCGYGSKTRLTLGGQDEEEELSSTFRRALSESNLNLMLNFVRTDETNQSLGKLDWSKKDGLNELGKPIMEIEGSGRGDGGGRIAGGGGRGSPLENFGEDFNSLDIYYQKMLEANPGNPLLLRNYAKFLHEVQYDMDKAEEYYRRALFASPGDGEILSIYAKFIWETHNDATRAKEYFERAVEVATQDCYVAASYAHFLWNSEEDEDEKSLSGTSPIHYGSVTAVGA